MSQTSALSAAAGVAAGTSLLYSTLVTAAAGSASAIGLPPDEVRKRIALAEWAAVAIVLAASLGASLASSSPGPVIVGGVAAAGLHYWWGQILA